jgi:glucose/arabinose dehydrogenase
VHGRRLPLYIALALALTACATDASAQVQLSDVGDFSSAMHVTAPPGDSRRLFVVEQHGTIRVVRDGVKLAEPFLNIDPAVGSGGEEGLLSMAFAPDYATSGRFYVYYTGTDSDNRVVEFRRSASDLDRADPSTGREVLELFHTDFGNHNGGQLQFGPDGYLYIATGDGGGGNDTHQNSQRLSGTPAEGNDANPLLGKLLRIDPNPSGGAAYTIPPDNPFVAEPPKRPEIWSYGLRNPWRFSFDRQTGDLWIGDVGQGVKEEIDFATTASGRGRGTNWGWPCWEGTRQNTDVPQPCSAPGAVPPFHEYDNPPAPGVQRAVVGGYVARDPTLGSLAGRYFYGDTYVSGLRSVDPSSAATDAPVAGTNSVSGLTSFGEDACGRLYAVTFSAVWRLEGATPAACNLPDPYPPGGGGGDPPPGPNPGPGVDDLPPDVAVSRRRVQRILRQRGVVIGAACSEQCTLAASGTISIPGAARVFRLRPRTRTLAPGTRVRIKLRLTRRTVRPLRRALRRGRRVRARVSVRASDPLGNARSVRKTVRARR